MPQWPQFMNLLNHVRTPLAGVGSPSASTALTLVNGLNSNITLPITQRVRIAGPSAGFSVGGFASGTDGDRIYLFNNLGQTMTLVNQDASSSAANQILTLTGANVVLRAGRSFATLSYDASISLWILESTN